MKLLKSLFRLASPAGARACLSVLIFHRVLLEPDHIFPDEMHARRFDEMCGWLATWFNVLPLDKAAAHLKAGTLPERVACITFDDGYADNHDVAVPILQRHGLPATFFIATGFLDGGCMWNDTVMEALRLTKASTLDLGELGRFTVSTPAEKASAIGAIIGKIKYLPALERLANAEGIARTAQVDPPSKLMMTSPQVKAMRLAGMQIGAHTLSHPILARLSVDETLAEIKGSKDFLEHLLGECVGLFAYPNGKPGEDYVPASVEVVRSLGFEAAVSTQWGVSRAGDDPFQIRRFTPWDKTRLRFGARLLANLRRA
jgi:peptidoglycan/xylan/chitin deacetylase (PgdA/CDA1 family)